MTDFESTKLDDPQPTSENPNTSPPMPQERPRPEPTSKDDAIRKAMEESGDTSTDEDDDDDEAEQPSTKREEKPAKVEAKKDKEPEPEKDKAVKGADPEKDDTGSEQKAEDKRQSEGRRVIEAPARFHPKAKAVWQNVPHPVREEFERVMKDTETEVSQYRESHENWQKVASFAERAKQGGTDLPTAVSRYVEMEDTLRNDPERGFKALLQNMQMRPQDAVGVILRAYGVSPQQLADHITRDPSAYTALSQQPQARNQYPQPQAPQQQAPNPEVVQLQQEVARMREEAVNRDVVTPFAQEYPDFYDHEQAIAKVLSSGILEQIHGNGLSPRDKLEAAYMMVVPTSARRSVGSENVEVPEASRDNEPAVDLRGTKSISGAPRGIDTNRRRKMSKDDAINEAMAAFGGR